MQNTVDEKGISKSISKVYNTDNLGIHIFEEDHNVFSLCTSISNSLLFCFVSLRCVRKSTIMILWMCVWVRPGACVYVRLHQYRSLNRPSIIVLGWKKRPHFVFFENTRANVSVCMWQKSECMCVCGSARNNVSLPHTQQRNREYNKENRKNRNIHVGKAGVSRIYMLTSYLCSEMV